MKIGKHFTLKQIKGLNTYNYLLLICIDSFCSNHVRSSSSGVSDGVAYSIYTIHTNKILKKMTNNNNKSPQK